MLIPNCCFLCCYKIVVVDYVISSQFRICLPLIVSFIAFKCEFKSSLLEVQTALATFIAELFD